MTSSTRSVNICLMLEELEIEGWFSSLSIVLPKVKTLKKLKILLPKNNLRNAHRHASVNAKLGHF